MNLRTNLVADLEEFSPLVGWVDGLEGPCLCLDVFSTSTWFGGELELVEHIRQWATDQRITGTAALADTLGTAWGVAHYGFSDIATSLAVRIVDPAELPTLLESLPVEALRLSPLTRSLLHELGLCTIGPLLSLPREDLAERFDPELLLRLDQALGQIPELFVSYRVLPKWEASQLWETSIWDVESLLTAWQDLLPKVLGPLSHRGRGVVRLLAELIGESHSTRRLVVGLLRPTLDARWLLDLLRLRMEVVRLCEPIVGTRLAVLEEAPFAVQQKVLFATVSPPIESSALASLVERLTGRLGSQAVVRIKRRTDHQPERAWSAEPWIRFDAATTTRPRASRGKSVPHEPMPPRPTLLLPEPRPIRVIAMAPQGHPQQFHDGHHESRITRCWGPERIETGWWRGASIRRDYYRVQTETAAQCWLFRELRTRQWFLHGWFD